MAPELPFLRRNGSSRKIIPASTIVDSDLLRMSPFRSLQSSIKTNKAAAILRSLVSFLPLRPFLASCRWSHASRITGTFSASSAPFGRAPPLGKRVTATIFGHRRGHVNFVVQAEPGSNPALVLEFAMPTRSLVKEMGSGFVRLALECERGGAGRTVLFGEPFWAMYCNGRKTGYAVSRECTEFDQKVLGLLRAVSIGAGVLPLTNCSNGDVGGGDIMYMRARFERVVGSCDSEAFYMMNPDGSGGPELSIFLIRI